MKNLLDSKVANKFIEIPEHHYSYRPSVSSGFKNNKNVKYYEEEIINSYSFLTTKNGVNLVEEETIVKDIKLNLSLSEIDILVLHHTVLPSLQSTIDMFSHGDSTVSSHYVVGKYDFDEESQVIQLVSECHRAHHAGISYWRNQTVINNNSIGIEVVNNAINEFSQKQMERVKDLCLDIMARNPLIIPERVLSHAEIGTVIWNDTFQSYTLRKVDPSLQFDWEYLSKWGVGIHIGDNYQEKGIQDLDLENILNRYGEKSVKISLLKRRLNNWGYKVLSLIKGGENEGLTDEFDDVLVWIIYAFSTRHLPKKIRQKLPSRLEKEDVFSIKKFNELRSKIFNYCQKNNLLDEEIVNMLSLKNTCIASYFESSNRYSLFFDDCFTKKINNLIKKASFSQVDCDEINSMIIEFNEDWNCVFRAEWDKYMINLREKIVWSKMHDKVLSYLEKTSKT